MLLIAGLGYPAEAWQAQLDGLADRYRLTAFDNRGAGRTPSPEEPADDAAAPLRALGIPAAHVAGFSGGSFIAQELALRHPQLVRSLVLMSTIGRVDACFRAMTDFWAWMVERAPSERWRQVEARGRQGRLRPLRGPGPLVMRRRPVGRRLDG
ncbi:alpha/beta fold hydrolase [Streptomyces sp. NPDC057623]|uniref:alpha/beta fold hydrolase n=1 Tax=Streptomyces sp. NPDC057623 TaxID=3346187 RepID=UPI0036CD9BDE